MLTRRMSRRMVLRYGAVAGTGLLSSYLLAACGDDDDEDGADAGQETMATEDEDPMDMEPTATEAMMMDPTATEEMTEPTATEEMMAEPTATEEMMVEPTATQEMMAEPTATEEAMMEPTESPENVLPLVSGWYRGAEVQYYDFGMNTPLAGGDAVATAPIYVLVYDNMGMGDPQFVEGQHNIVDVVPGDEGYSDLWQVVLVTVPDDYEADSIRSAADLNEMMYPMMPTEMYVNCPVVPEDTMLEGGEPLVQGWYRDEPVYYPDFGMNPPVAIPIWAFITGVDSDGNPQFVEGQHNVIDAVPGDEGYSALWRVNLVTVPEDYEPDSIRDAADIDEMMYEITQTDLAVNCPVTVF